MKKENVANARRKYPMDHIVRHVGRSHNAGFALSGMATTQLTLRWNAQPTFSNTSSTGIGAESETRRQSDKDRDKEI